jgi:hypothetical protein
MAIYELINEEKARARVGPHISSQEGKDKITQLSSEVFIALEQRKQDWLTKYICKGEGSYAKHTLVQNILG